MSESPDRPLEQQITLLELVDRVLNKGVVLSGDITLSVADVDLVYVGLRVLLSSVATLEGQNERVLADGPREAAWCSASHPSHSLWEAKAMTGRPSTLRASNSSPNDWM